MNLNTKRTKEHEEKPLWFFVFVVFDLWKVMKFYTGFNWNTLITQLLIA